MVVVRELLAEWCRGDLFENLHLQVFCVDPPRLRLDKHSSECKQLRLRNILQKQRQTIYIAELIFLLLVVALMQ